MRTAIMESDQVFCIRGRGREGRTSDAAGIVGRCAIDQPGLHQPPTRQWPPPPISMLSQNKNIATGETSQAFTPFHFLQDNAQTVNGNCVINCCIRLFPLAKDRSVDLETFWWKLVLPISKEIILDLQSILSQAGLATQAAPGKKRLRTLAAEKGSLYWSLVLSSHWLMGGKGWPVAANERRRKKSGANPSPSSGRPKNRQCHTQRRARTFDFPCAVQL